MKRHARAGYAGALALAALVPAPARAQEDFEAIVLQMRACARLTEMAARAACYDANIGPAPQNADVARAPRPAVQAPPPSFGADSLPQTYAEERETVAQAAELQVTAIIPREPGIYLLSFADGAQWQFTEAAPSSYDAPRRGDRVTIERRALGGFAMRFADQRPIRIKRLR